MKTKTLILALGLGLLASRAQADRLVIKGSDTLGAKLVPQLAEAFKAKHPETTFDIAAEGSTTGIAAIIDRYGADRHGQPAGQAGRDRRGFRQRSAHEANDCRL